MNAKTIKKLRKRIKPIQVEWMKSLLPDEQANNITVKNVNDILPEQTHVYTTEGVIYSYMTDKYIMKRLKKYPHIKNYKQLMEVIADEGISDNSSL
jgi:hypothetical protein